MSDRPDTAPQPGRRSFLSLATRGLGLLVAAIPAIPGAAYLLAPLRRSRREADWTPLVAAETLKPGAPPVRLDVVGTRWDGWTRYDRVKQGSVWARRDDAGNVQCLSTACPHLGCAIALDGEHQRFRCPCHGSDFELDGSRGDGPSPRGMDELETRVVDGRIEVRFQRFRGGVAEREPV